MIFDTDVMIWAFRGNGKALDAIDEATTRSISSVTYMELLQGVRNKAEMLSMKRFLSTLGFATLLHGKRSHPMHGRVSRRIRLQQQR